MIFSLTDGLGRHLRDALTRAYRSSFRPRLSSEREKQGLFRAGATWPVEAKPSPAIFMRELASLAARMQATDPEFYGEEINRLTGVSYGAPL